MKFRDKVAPLLLFILAIMLGLNIYSFSTFQLNAFNIGAFFLTLTGLNQGSVTNKTINKGSIGLRSINIGIGIFMLILAAFAKGFKYYDFLAVIINSIDTNALLLLGIAATLWSFKLSDEKSLNTENHYNKKLQDYREKYLNEKEKKINLSNQVKDLQDINKQLVNAQREAHLIIEKEKKRGKNSNE